MSQAWSRRDALLLVGSEAKLGAYGGPQRPHTTALEGHLKTSPVWQSCRLVEHPPSMHEVLGLMPSTSPTHHGYTGTLSTPVLERWTQKYQFEVFSHYIVSFEVRLGLIRPICK